MDLLKIGDLVEKSGSAVHRRGRIIAIEDVGHQRWCTVLWEEVQRADNPTVEPDAVLRRLSR